MSNSHILEVHKQMHCRKFGPVSASCKVAWVSEHFNFQPSYAEMFRASRNLSRGLFSISIFYFEIKEGAKEKNVLSAPDPVIMTKWC